MKLTLWLQNVLMCGLFGHKISLARLRGVVAAQLKKLRGLAVCVGLMGAGLVAHAQPGTILLQSDFDDGLVACDPLGPTWASSDTDLAEVGTFTSQSGTCSVFTRGGAVSITSVTLDTSCLLYTSPSPRDQRGSRMPSSA